MCDERGMECQKKEEDTTFKVREVVFAEERVRRFEEGLGQKCGSDASSQLPKHAQQTYAVVKGNSSARFFRAPVGCCC